MSFQVIVTDGATRDLEWLYDYIERHDGSDKADYVLKQIEKAVLGISNRTERGSYPKELLHIGMKDYCEVFFKPYRIIYRRLGENVYVVVIADGRKDMRTLLERRLLET